MPRLGRPCAHLNIALVAWACAWAWACATGPHEVTHPYDERLLRHGEGPAVTVLPSPSPDRVELALYVDAGSRDAQKPEVATLAARLAAAAIGPMALGRSLPDAIELRLSCTRTELPTCLDRLALGLALRRLSPRGFALARAALIDDQRDALGRDRGRAAEQAALEALFGVRGVGFLPLGAPDDARASAREVEDFLAAHFGRGRALLVAAGAIDANALAKLAASRFARVPVSRATRRTSRWAARDGVRVEVADDHALRIALLAPTHARALDAAGALRDALLRSGASGSVEGHVLPVRDGGLAIVRVLPSLPSATAAARRHKPSADAWVRTAAQIAREAAAAIERHRLEGWPTRGPVARSSALDAAMQRAGLRFAAGHTDGHTDGHANDQRVAIGIGVLLAGGRADDVTAKDPDAELRGRAQRELERAFAAGRALSRPRLEGTLTALRTDVRLGAALRVQALRTSSQDLEALIALAPGAARDAPTHHGRAALLATLASTACAGRTAQALSAELADLGARLEPFVDSARWGLLLRAPKEHARAALALLAECVSRPSFDARDLALALRTLEGRLASDDAALDWRALVAHALLPRAPGTLAPLGSSERLPANDLRALRGLLASSLQRPDVRVAISGPTPADDAALRVSRRLSFMAQRAPEPARPAERHAVDAVEPPHAVDAVEPPHAVDVMELPEPAHPTRALILWSLETKVHAPEALKALSILLAQRAAFPGTQLAFHDGDSDGKRAFVALGARGAPVDLAAIAAKAGELMGKVPRLSRWRALLGPARAADARGLSPAPALAAMSPARSTDREAEALLERLRTTPPRVVLLP